jgi:transcriptional regulator with XRE-family HTH domain
VFSEPYQALIDIVVAARREAGVSQRRLAAMLGKSASHVSMIERGQRRLDTLEFYQIAVSLNLRPSTLLARVENHLAGLASLSRAEPQQLPSLAPTYLKSAG